MKDYTDINATFQESKKGKPNEYKIKKQRVFTIIGENLSRINPKSPLYTFGFGNVIDMEFENGVYIPEWESNQEKGSYREEMRRELANLPSMYKELKYTGTKLKTFSTGLVKKLSSKINRKFVKRN